MDLAGDDLGDEDTHQTRVETQLAHAGRDPAGIAVSAPVYRASSLVFRSVEELRQKTAAPWEHGSSFYGRWGTPTTQALEDALVAIEPGAVRAAVCASGCAAIATALMAFLRAGDHLLVQDSIYGPARRFCSNDLQRFGVAVEFFPAREEPGALRARCRPQTRALYLEAPSSLTYEVPDVEGLARAAREALGEACVVLLDNSWATPLGLHPLQLGCDVSLYSCSKYLGGHSDAMLGAALFSHTAHFRRFKTQQSKLGGCAGSEEAALVLRGLRTLALRLPAHAASARALASWLHARPQVKAVLYPALPDSPSHAAFARFFKGASGTFAFVLREGYADADLGPMLDSCALFRLGYGWGGFESLLIPEDVRSLRAPGEWPPDDILLRIHVGLEAVEDLIADLQRAFERLDAARAARLGAPPPPPAL